MIKFTKLCHQGIMNVYHILWQSVQKLQIAKGKAHQHAIIARSPKCHST